MSTLAFVDTETLGLDPLIHPIWEVALILRQDWTDTEHVWQLPVSDWDVQRAHPQALEITRFHDRYDPAGVTSRDAFMDGFAELTHGAHLVGAVPSFDEERLRRMFVRYDRQWHWHYHLIDVEALTVGFLAGRGERVPLPWDSRELSQRIGVQSRENAHEALEDARWARDIYDRVVTQVTEEGR